MWLFLYKVSSPSAKILNRIFYQNIRVICVIFLILDWLLIILKIRKLDHAESDDDVVELEWEKTLLHFGFFWFLIDYTFLIVSSACLNLSNKNKRTSNMSVKISQLSNNNMYIFNNNMGILSFSQTFLYGARSI